MKPCTVCKIEKPLAEFSVRKCRQNRPRSECKSCQTSRSRRYALQHPAKARQWVKDAKAKLTKFIREAKSKPCADCGVSYPSYVMDFDHRDRKMKKFNLSQAKGLAGIEPILAEIAKCDVVCSNCHRERTHGKYVHQSVA